MGDRCHLEVTFRQEDRSQFLTFMGYEGEFCNEWEEAPGVITAVEWEANYACHPELETLATHGVPFYGQHGAGGTYPEGVFASAEGVYVACDAIDGSPVVPVREDGTPDPEPLATAREFWHTWRQAQALVRGQPAEPEPRPSWGNL